MKSQKTPAVVLALDAFQTHGGIQRYTQRLLTTLVRSSDSFGISSVTLVSLRDYQPGDIEGVKYVFASGNRLKFALQVLREAIICRKDAFVISTHIHLAPLLLAFTINRNRRPCVVAHGAEVWTSDRVRKLPKLALSTGRIRPVAVSKTTAERMRSPWSLRSEVQILTCAIDIPEKWRSPRRHLKNVQLLSVSRLFAEDDGKHVDQLIRSMKFLQAMEGAITLRIVGDGNNKLVLEKLSVDLGTENLVEFLGPLNGEDLRSQYELSDIFVLPSTREGFGIVYLEAWVHGLAVIGGNDGGSSEVIEDGVDGLTTPPDAAQISKAIRKLATNDPFRLQLIERGRRKVASKYSQPVFEEQLNHLISEARG